jgi:hypothetical protein
MGCRTLNEIATALHGLLLAYAQSSMPLAA